MKNAILISILSVVLVAGAASVYAGAPINGTYKSSDGDLYEGRETTSWVGGSFLATGNVFHSVAWNGADLSLEWYIQCPVVTNVDLVADLVFNGYGSRIYNITYAGGSLRFGGTDLGTSWANVDSYYTGVVTDFTEIRTLIFENNVMVGSDSDFSFSGTINNYPQTCVYGIANGAWLGNGFGFDYPLARGENCSLTGPAGHYADTRDITLTFGSCTVGTEESSWGKVKSLYRD